ncbi:hypothetical protein ACIBG0_35810 [Nocardia sp. NPDC050630]|uniref:hypothetical protein n=1 Tax=Nocardia sp. NPDC050630 TaxID=3364321 RepID=UPI00379ED047
MPLDEPADSVPTATAIFGGSDVQIMWQSTASAEVTHRFGRVRRHWWEGKRRRLRRDLEEFVGDPPTSEMDALLKLVAESDLRAVDYRAISKRWQQAYFLLGLPAAILAAVAGAAGLSSEQFRVVAGLVALGASGLSAAATFLNSGDRAVVATALCSAWQELADDARMCVLQLKRPGAADRPADIGGVLLRLHRRKHQLLREELPGREAQDIGGGA